MTLPSTEMVNSQRISKFKQSITDVLAGGELDFMQGILESYQQEHDISPIEIAAALAKLVTGDKSLLLEPERKPRHEKKKSDGRRSEPGKEEKSQKRGRRPSKGRQKGLAEGMEMFRIEVGHDHEVQPGNIVGAIASEAGLDGEHIGHVDIRDAFSYVELPEGMPKDVFTDLKKTWVSGQQLKISRVESSGSPAPVKKKPRSSATGVKKASKKKKASKDREVKRKPRRKPTQRPPAAS
ncbi:MAG: hypothetical protein HN816_02345 [Gammaproteobacteria bacterium]|nr:hypothetical protein [Gammaproteobacteria bacterium]